VNVKPLLQNDFKKNFTKNSIFENRKISVGSKHQSDCNQSRMK